MLKEKAYQLNKNIGFFLTYKLVVKMYITINFI